jgi:uncharacterized cupin superfamily protein
MPKINIAALPVRTTTGYPDLWKPACAGREKRALGDAAGLTQFGVNLTTLLPGAASSLLHWHAEEDELVYVLSGEVVLVEGETETVLRPGDAAGFRAGDPVGHTLHNRTDAPVTLIEVGTRSATELVTYPGIDLLMDGRDGARRYTRLSGDPY